MKLRQMMPLPRPHSRKFSQLVVAVFAAILFILGCHHFAVPLAPAPDVLLVVIQDQEANNVNRNILHIKDSQAYYDDNSGSLIDQKQGTDSNVHRDEEQLPQEILARDDLTTITNDQEQENETITTAKYSSFKMLDHPTQGETLNVQVHARDALNNSRTTGGDFFYATASSSKDVFQSTSGHLIDHDNGTYSVGLYIGWSGSTEINITLVHPSAATNVLDDIRMAAIPLRYWNGTFYDSKSKQTEYSVCYMAYHRELGNRCVYSNQAALGNQTAFVCERPANNFSCDSIVEYTGCRNPTNRNLLTLGGKHEWKFSKENCYQRITNGPLFIEAEMTNKTNVELPNCNLEKQNRKVGMSPGYWTNNKWISLICKTKQWLTPENALQLGKCLENRTMHLLADSTRRQWARALHDFFETNDYNMRVSDGSSRYSFDFDVATFNLSIIYQMHPQYVSTHWTPVDAVKYEVDVIDKVSSEQCNSIIVVGPWAHFGAWRTTAYKERLLLLKASLQRLLRRCPNTFIVIKSPHAFSAQDDRIYPLLYLNNSDYIFYQMNLYMREIFDDNRMLLLETWDMNLAYPAKSLHMPQPVIRQELNMFLSYLCR